MDTKTRKLNARKQWLEAYRKYGNVSIAARRCGIPRSTLYRWIQRYNERGEPGLNDISQKPNTLAKQKITTDLENLILDVRSKNKFGPQRISTHLLREYKIELSTSTIWRVLQKNNAKPLKRYRPKNDLALN
jgi:transposase